MLGLIDLMSRLHWTKSFRKDERGPRMSTRRDGVSGRTAGDRRRHSLCVGKRYGSIIGGKQIGQSFRSDIDSQDVCHSRAEGTW